MKYKDLEDALENLDELEKLLTERIFENNIAAENQPGLMVKQFVHCFVLYREKVWNAKQLIKNVKQAKKSK